MRTLSALLLMIYSRKRLAVFSINVFTLANNDLVFAVENNWIFNNLFNVGIFQTRVLNIGIDEHKNPQIPVT